METLRNALADGTIDAIQSGHMPRSREKKMDDLDVSPFGGASLETTLATTITYMVAEQLIDWKTAIDRLSTAPARIAGVPGGTLKPGATADIVIIDPAATWTVDGTRFRSNCISSPLEGHSLQGRATHTIVGGEIRYRLQPELEHLAWSVTANRF